MQKGKNVEKLKNTNKNDGFSFVLSRSSNSEALMKIIIVMVKKVKKKINKHLTTTVA